MHSGLCANHFRDLRRQHLLAERLVQPRERAARLAQAAKMEAQGRLARVVSSSAMSTWGSLSPARSSPPEAATSRACSVSCRSGPTSGGSTSALRGRPGTKTGQCRRRTSPRANATTHRRRQRADRTPTRQPGAEVTGSETKTLTAPSRVTLRNTAGRSGASRATFSGRTGRPTTSSWCSSERATILSLASTTTAMPPLGGFALASRSCRRLALVISTTTSIHRPSRSRIGAATS